jgi:hypothetical protein
MMRLRSAALPALLLAAGLAAPVRADDYYFMMVFGSEAPGFNPKYSHSFATFVHVRGCNGVLDTGYVEHVTISWLPVDGDIVVLRPVPECGRNWGLHETLNLVTSEGERVSMWGPYQVRKELYDRAVAQATYLNSGAVRYKAIDTGYPSSRVSNCIHAVDDISYETPRLLLGTTGWGEPASYYLTLTLRPWIVDECRTHDWLIGRLGLHCYRITRRDLARSPLERPLLRAAQDLAHLPLTRNR